MEDEIGEILRTEDNQKMKRIEERIKRYEWLNRL